MKYPTIRSLSAMTVLAVLGASCDANDEIGGGAGVADEEPPTGGQSAIEIRSETSYAELSGMRYSLTPVDCGTGADLGPVIEIDRPLEDQTIPGNLPDHQNDPLDEDSAHRFADLFEVVDPGCWDVMSTPLGPDGTPSEECAAAWKNGVVVHEGETTEVFLLNQCMGSDRGGIDLIAALNEEPNLDDVDFLDSKFICGGPTPICARGSDPDDDPLEFELIAADGCEVAPIDPVDDYDACFELTCHDWGRFDLTMRVYDLAWRDGDLVRIEDWLAEEGYPNESHGELGFFAYFDGIKHYPDADGDGFGDADADPTLVCEGDEPPPGTLPNDGDCDDDEALSNPAAEEVCDTVDNDCDGDVDEGITFDQDAEIVLLQDLSGSFYDDLPNVSAALPSLHAGINECVGEARFGLGSFIDKPFSPFGNVGDYSYRADLALTADLAALTAAFDALTLGSGGDGAEAQLVALMHAALDEAYYGFTTSAKRVFVLFTDYSNHVAGDCGAGTCTSGANDGDATLDEYEDYPAISQAATALAAVGVEVVFAVTSSQVSHYESLLTNLGVDGSVVTLSSDSSNLTSAVLEGLQCACPSAGG